MRVVQEWLSVRPEDAPHQYLFCTDRTRRLSKQGLATIQRDIYARADVPYPLRPLHSIRHTYASEMLEKGVDKKTISELMGHADTKTVELYFHTTEERKRRASMLIGLTPPHAALVQSVQQQKTADPVNKSRRRIVLNRRLA